MSRAQPKSSPMDRHARSIAAAIAKGRPPALTPDLDLYLESSPREIFVALEGAARHMSPGGNDETLGLGYLFLLQQLLERLRYRTDRGYADAARLDDNTPWYPAFNNGQFHLAIRLGLEQLNRARTNPARYAMPKGTPFYFMGIAAFASHDYQTAIQSAAGRPRPSFPR